MKLPKNFKTINREFYSFQYETFVFCIQRKNAGIFITMGGGKTFCAISIARYRLQKDEIRKVLVVCPSSILYNWEDEISKFSEYKPMILHGPDRLYKTIKAKYTFGIINYESLFPLLKDLGAVHYNKRISLASDIDKRIESLQFDMIIFDESARFIRNYKAQRTVASVLLADRAKYKLILTGTPIANKPLDIWSQFRVLDGGASFSKSFKYFQETFFYKRSNHPWAKHILRPDRVSLMSKLIYQTCIRKTKKEVLKDLPEQVYQTIWIDPDPQTTKIYEDVRHQILSEIPTLQGKAQLKITNILQRILRLQQITGGFTVKNGETVELENQPKLDALIEQIELIVDAEESVIVWCRFKKSMAMIANRLKKLKIKHVTMSGDDNEKSKYSKWKGFQKDKSMSVFIGQVDSGGIGIELFKHDSKSNEKQHTIFYENAFTLDTREQAMARTHRIGQKSVCFYQDLVIKGTIDERILRSLKTKKDIADVILGEGVKGFLE